MRGLALSQGGIGVDHERVAAAEHHWRRQRAVGCQLRQRLHHVIEPQRTAGRAASASGGFRCAALW